MKVKDFYEICRIFLGLFFEISFKILYEICRNFLGFFWDFFEKWFTPRVLRFLSFRSSCITNPTFTQLLHTSTKTGTNSLLYNLLRFEIFLNNKTKPTKIYWYNCLYFIIY